MDIELIGVSLNIQRIKDMIQKVADTCVNVLVCAERRKPNESHRRITWK